MSTDTAVRSRLIGSRTRNLVGLLVVAVALIAGTVVWARTMSAWDDEIGIVAWVLYATFAIAPLLVCLLLAATVMRRILPAKHDQHVVMFSAVAGSATDLRTVIEGEGEKENEHRLELLDSIVVRCPSCQKDAIGRPGTNVECGACFRETRLPQVHLYPDRDDGLFAAEHTPCGNWLQGKAGEEVTCATCGGIGLMPRPA